MIFSTSSILHPFFTAILVWYFFGSIVANANQTANMEKTPLHTTTKTKTPSTTSTATSSENTTTVVIRIDTDTNTTSLVIPAVRGGDDDATEAITSTPSNVRLPTVLSTLVAVIVTNSTSKPAKKGFVTTEILIGAIVAAVALVVLITAVIVYVLIRKGYITVFNQPRQPLKSDEQNRMVDSSSTVDRQSSSQRDSNIN